MALKANQNAMVEVFKGRALLYVHCVSDEDLTLIPLKFSCIQVVCREIHVSFTEELSVRRVALTPIMVISIYTLSDLGDLSNLIGSLSRTIQQYSSSSEWIMCELGFFPLFLENDLLKVDKILGLIFFKARKEMEGFNTVFLNLL